MKQNNQAVWPQIQKYGRKLKGKLCTLLVPADFLLITVRVDNQGFKVWCFQIEGNRLTAHITEASFLFFNLYFLQFLLIVVYIILRLLSCKHVQFNENVL